MGMPRRLALKALGYAGQRAIGSLGGYGAFRQWVGPALQYYTGGGGGPGNPRYSNYTYPGPYYPGGVQKTVRGIHFSKYVFQHPNTRAWLLHHPQIRA